MKIIFTVHTYYPNSDGVQYVTQYLAEGLAKKGHEVTVLTVNSERTKEYKHNGVNVVSIFFKTKCSFPYKGKVEYIDTFKRLTKNCDALINCCVQSPNNNCLLPYLKEINCKKILYLHGMHYFRINKEEYKAPKYFVWHLLMNMRWFLFYKFSAKYFRQYDLMIDIHPNSPTFDYMKKLDVNCNMQVVLNAVENFEFTEITQNVVKQYPYIKKKYFLCVANYDKLKNQEMLVKAYLKVKEKKDYELVCIGKKSDYSNYLKEITSEEQNVHILENIPREITKMFIFNATCGVLSSQKEVYPIFICETIACQHPYISTNVGSVEEIPGGLVVETINEMSEAMQRIISDEKLGRYLADKGYMFAKENLIQEKKISELEKLIVSEASK